ncbi:MAG TPA: Hsp20/alpha crystallin family protein [Flavobacteriales bacterium]
MFITKFRPNVPVLNRNNSLFFDDQIFRDFFSDVWSGGSIMPATNIKETDNGYMIELAAPGLDKSDFKIRVDNNMLEISSEKSQESNQEEERYTRREFHYSSFKRSWTLPETVDTDAISANYVNGVLNVSLPKKKEAVKNGNKFIEVQ